ncbi:LamG-like jellyroll fold domain-containing protein [Granulosicoccus antarcticus]|uniref:PASTA domain-containing protein n=1 Tax=Granulosicoccus antarcticus IMCC3135 TaxID=1192854 RepID=A0A2Z2NKQ1_9GAMM|nr:LamG-like jellyroll fold domain-containing protein [Granulosicoccus antarcticus]ASJ71982.1 hypothetical protein IMCC3135_09425 [Granulosicoccus antarcticus IMCC3135]
MSGALHIGDDNQWVTLGSAPRLGFGTQGFTIEMWVRLDELKSNSIHLLGSTNFTYPDSFNLLIGSDGKPWVGHESNYLNARKPVTAGHWFHLAYRYDGSGDGPNGGQLLINGVIDVSSNFEMKGQVKADLFLGPGPLALGSVSGGFDITELRFWPGPRSDGKIREQMFSRWDSRDRGIAAYWPLDSENRFESPMQSGVVVPSTEFGFIEDDSVPVDLDRDAVTQGLLKGESSVTLDENRDLIGLDIFTAEVWVFGDQKPDELYNSPVLSQHGAPTGWELRAAAGMAEFLITINGEHLTVGWSADPTPGWFHVAGVYDKSQIRLVINGIVVSRLSVTGELAHYERPVTVGRNRNWPARAFQGALAEARIWKTARTDAQIWSQLFTRAGGNEPGLVAVLPLDDWPTGSVRDLVSETSHPVDNPLASVRRAPPLEAIADADPETNEPTETEQLENLRTERIELLRRVERAEILLGEMDELEELAEKGRQAQSEVQELRTQVAELQNAQPDEITSPDRELEPGETTLQSLINQTRAQIEAARVAVNQGGGVYRLRDVTMDLRVIPAAGGETVIIPDRKELVDLSGGELSHLRLDFSSTDIGQAEPVLVKVPDVSGYTQVLARRKLSEVGLLTEVMLEALSEDRKSQARRVVDQLPQAGTDVSPQSTVTIFVGRLATSST